MGENDGLTKSLIAGELGVDPDKFSLEELRVMASREVSSRDAPIGDTAPGTTVLGYIGFIP